MRILKFTLICCIAMLLAIGCASEKKMEQAAESAQLPQLQKPILLLARICPQQLH